MEVSSVQSLLICRAGGIADNLACAKLAWHPLIQSQRLQELRDTNALVQRTPALPMLCLLAQVTAPHSQLSLSTSCPVTVFVHVYPSYRQIGCLWKVKLASVCVYDFYVCILCNLSSLASKFSNKMECKKLCGLNIWVLRTSLELRNYPCLKTVEPSISLIFRVFSLLHPHAEPSCLYMEKIIPFVLYAT